ncbi:MAG TPA: HlyD family efflux transporter periplasmic adaptor subunit [Desulfobulbaceae bacterium]|nr:HlyD family efflux transporter periplasmic adaptor subunit [Desulfobulbaceae bacterium]
MRHTPNTEGETFTISAPDLRQLTALFSSSAFQQADRRTLLQQFLQQTIALINAAGAVYFSRQGTNLTPEMSLLARQMQSRGDALNDELKSCALNALSREEVCYNRFGGSSSMYCISCPVPLNKGCLTVLLVTDHGSLSPFIVTLQLLAALLDQYLLQEKTTIKSNADPSLSIQFLPTLSTLFSLPPGKERILHLNQSLKLFTGADLSVLARGKNGKNIHISALSDVASLDRRTHQIRLLQKGIDECVLRGVPLCWPESDDKSTQGSLVLEEIGRNTGGAQVMAIPLAAEGNAPHAVLLLTWKTLADRSQIQQALSGFAPVLSGILPCLDKAKGKQGSDQKQIKPGAHWTLQNKVTTAVAACLVLLLLLPVPYRLAAEAIVQPRVTRFVVSRYDGLLIEARVRPGDRVEKGDILARLDGRETEVKLASLQAEMDKAKKLFDQATALGNTPAAQVARLDMLRYEQQLTRLREHRDHLTLTSPVTGMVLTGDLQRAEGSPVSRGQTLFEVAPLAQMEVEVAIDEQDIAQVPNNAVVTIRFDAYQDLSWKKKFERIEPRAQIRNNQNVFVGILEFDNPQGRLHPGMRGTAKIHAGTRLLGWIIFRKPWHTLLRLFDSLL